MANTAAFPSAAATPRASRTFGVGAGERLGPQAVPVDPADIIVFGGTGDLAMRKLLPALYHRYRDGQLPADSRIIALSREPIDDDGYRATVSVRAKGHADPDVDPQAWDRFLQRLHHVSVDATKPEGWDAVRALADAAANRVRVFYLACAPQLFGTVCRRLRDAGLVTEESRVVLEKPIGWDLDSARRINEEVGEVFREDQVFRIDHYLGKETVQNLLVLRFANMLLEPLWTNQWIDHVQITVAETVGVGARGGYYDNSGAMRDMVQNHLLQLLCLMAMEPPTRIDMDAVRDEKLKVLLALRPLIGEDAIRSTVRGQYRSGAVAGEPVPGYTDELGTGFSRTETFVALKAMVDNWRWAGVPFYLRTGKRMHTRSSEIVIQFKPVPHSVFPKGVGPITPNLLVTHLQPDESVRLHIMAKEPGPGGLHLRPVPLNLSFAEAFASRSADAYERLLMDVVRGNPTLFMRRDEVEAAWGWAEPILHAWEASDEAPRPYHAGTTGPSAAIALIERDGRTWHEEAFG
jgi:glucose-6-phosphate 1-dehydrogenase